MPPVPVRIDDPIAPTKPQGATPQTTEQQQQPPSNIQPSTTQNSAPAYPAARPGAVPAVPQPTPYVPQPQPSPSRTQPLPAAQNVPPPPQPGAVPLPPSQQVPVATTTLPPPPKAGETLQQRQQTTLPPQAAIPPPQQNHAPTHSTATTTAAGAGYVPPTAVSQQPYGPTTLNLGPVPVSAPHPPGYHQNIAAQEMTPQQRASLDNQERKESVLGQLGGDGAGDAAESMWNTVKGWASTAGEKLVETEESIWRKINQR